MPEEKAHSTPRYRSTRGGQSGLSFEAAVFEGLATDGGLLVPDWVPSVSEFYKSWVKLPFDELAYEIISRYCSEDEIPSSDLRAILKKSYSTFEHPEVVPCRKVGDIHVMELFHGPSLSFKDVALQGLGNLYEFFLTRNPRRLTILAATSGDTGSAAIHGLAGKSTVDCFVLFPEGRVSPVQQLQMTSVLDPNVHCLSVKGTFDDCQNIVKELMSDLDFKKKFGIGAVNSINWARIMLQITYYFYTYYKLFPECDGTVTFSVPTGNFGDILAGYYAKRMGLPIKHLVVATNSNDILDRFFNSGTYAKGLVHQTTSPSMDIQISSNFERYLFYLLGENGGQLMNSMVSFRNTGELRVSREQLECAGKDFMSSSSTDEQVAETMKSYYETHGYMLCPHTACAVSSVEKRKLHKEAGHEVVVLGTAHPAKFRESVVQATGKEPELLPALVRMKDAKTRLQALPASAQSVHDTIQRNLYFRGTYLHFDDRPTPERCEALEGEPGNWLVALDVEGTLVGEAWLELQKKTGIEELKLTTAHEPDYDKLMRHRIDALRRHGIKLEDMKSVIGDMQPLPGCEKFLSWLKTLVPRVLLLTDTFEEYAMPLFDKLGYPCVFCNSLIVDEEGFITGHKLRLRDQKRKAVESFQRLNFRVIAIGDSFNDISMMKAAERGILMNASEKVVVAHGSEFPMCTDYGILRDRILDIVMKPPLVPPKPLVVPGPLAEDRKMWLVLTNVSGTFAPDPWPALAAMTGIDELKTTSAHVPDYDDLMKRRMKILKQNGLTLQNVYDKLKGMEPKPGAKDFLAWLKPVVPRSFMISDSFEEFALPIFQKLGHPMVFCNFLEPDSEGYLCRHIVRLKDQKRLACEEFQRLNFRVIAIGASYLDIPMLKTAEKSLLFDPSDALVAAHPEIPAARNYEELKTHILEIVANSRKRKAPDS
jgi:threonine synthase